MNLNIKVSIKNTTLPVASTSFTPGTTPYMHKEDEDIFGGIRSCASCPAVFVLKDDSHNSITKQWQYYMLAINPAMTLENVFYLLDNNLAFTNSTGFRNDGDPRADYFHNKDIAFKPPQFDKVRTCSRNCVTGIEQGGMLSVKTFDIRVAPPLKPGKVYPNNLSEIKPDDYLYTPRYNREMFIVANIVNGAGEVVQFPRGGLYDWTNDNTPYSFLPLCSNPAYGPVLVPLDRFRKLPVDSPVPSPYRNS
jgi:hypothetical protein